MLYQINLRNVETGEERTEVVNARNAKIAVETVTTAMQDNEKVTHVYASTEWTAYHLMRSGLLIAKKSAEKTLERGGNETQQMICRDLTIANAKAGAVGAEEMGASYIMELASHMSAQAQDVHAWAYTGLMDAIKGGEDIHGQYHNAFLEINAYIMQERTNEERTVRTEYIKESGGDLVAINSYIARLVKGGERYYPTASDTMDAETAERLGDVLADCSANITPRQRQIVILLERGLSQRRIADKLKCGKGTVSEHVAKIRSVYAKGIDEDAEFTHLIKSIETYDAEQRRKANRHKQSEEHRRKDAERKREERRRRREEAEREARKAEQGGLITWTHGADFEQAEAERRRAEEAKQREKAKRSGKIAKNYL